MADEESVFEEVGGQANDGEDSQALIPQDQLNGGDFAVLNNHTIQGEEAGVEYEVLRTGMRRNQNDPAVAVVRSTKSGKHYKVRHNQLRVVNPVKPPPGTQVVERPKGAAPRAVARTRGGKAGTQWQRGEEPKEGEK